mmetsp:Transcript_83390/g.153076  ORF Transcript_83390/g.153076 Transcript_83390/m.153076 type:complete len:97 (-) Transcript_83390:821-1111(-)
MQRRPSASRPSGPPWVEVPFVFGVTIINAERLHCSVEDISPVSLHARPYRRRAERPLQPNGWRIHGRMNGSRHQNLRNCLNAFLIWVVMNSSGGIR